MLALSSSWDREVEKGGFEAPKKEKGSATSQFTTQRT